MGFLWFLVSGQPIREEKICLYGIDCPEKRRAFGNEAGRFASNLILGNVVEVRRVIRTSPVPG